MRWRYNTAVRLGWGGELGKVFSGARCMRDTIMLTDGFIAISCCLGLAQLAVGRGVKVWEEAAIRMSLFPRQGKLASGRLEGEAATGAASGGTAIRGVVPQPLGAC